MMTPLPPDFRHAFAGAQPLCLSLFQPTHRHHPDNRQDPTRFGNLAQELEQSLGQKYPADEIARLLKPFEELAGDAEFWNHTRDGLAVFAAPGVFQIFGTQRPPPELAVVAESFHTKPLWRLRQSADRYQVVALSRDSVRLFDGNRDVLDDNDLAAGVPRNAHRSARRGSDGAAHDGGLLRWHGRGEHGDASRPRREERQVETDNERFFGAVDKEITEHHSRLWPYVTQSFQSLSRRLDHGSTCSFIRATDRSVAISRYENPLQFHQRIAHHLLRAVRG